LGAQGRLKIVKVKPPIPVLNL